jgi:hypothetical protein
VGDAAARRRRDGAGMQLSGGVAGATVVQGGCGWMGLLGRLVRGREDWWGCCMGAAGVGGAATVQ